MLSGGRSACTPQGPQYCLVHRLQLPSQSSQQICRVPHATPHQSALLTRRSTMQVGYDVVCHSCLGLGARCWHADRCHAHRLLCPCCQGGRCISVRCAAPAPEQPEGQSEPEITKQCLRCGETRSLFYFPTRKSHPKGWVHCFACQSELWLQVRPPRRCAPPLHTSCSEEPLIASCGLQGSSLSCILCTTTAKALYVIHQVDTCHTLVAPELRESEPYSCMYTAQGGAQ